MPYLSSKSASLIAALLAFGMQSPMQALPGDTLEVARTRLSSSPLLEGVNLQRQGSAPYIWYEATIQHNGSTVKVSVSPPASHWENSVSVAIRISQSTIGSRLSTQDYNLRQDEAFLEILQRLYGDDVVQDFIGSRFTDRRQEVTNEYRTAYRGERFGYIANVPPASSHELHFVILSHSDWEFRRVPYGI